MGGAERQEMGMSRLRIELPKRVVKSRPHCPDVFHLEVSYVHPGVKMASQAQKKKQAATDVINISEEIATLLVCRAPLLTPIQTAYPERQNCHLTRHQLSLCVSLIQNGVNPEALAVSAFSFSATSSC